MFRWGQLVGQSGVEYSFESLFLLASYEFMSFKKSFMYFYVYIYVPAGPCVYRVSAPSTEMRRECWI